MKTLPASREYTAYDAARSEYRARPTKANEAAMLNAFYAWRDSVEARRQTTWQEEESEALP